MISVEEAHEVTVELTAAFERLTPQLSSSNPPPSADRLAAIIGQPGTSLFVARLDGELVGTLTLVTFPIPTAIRAWIEDVVVDSAAAGHRAGEALTRAALDKAKALGAKTVELTSRPSLEAANHIYQKLGFQIRNTNVYRYDL